MPRRVHPRQRVLTAVVHACFQDRRDETAVRLSPCVPRSETRKRADADGMQHLLSRAVWDTARDEQFAYVTVHLGDSEGVVVIDETGFPKKETCLSGGCPAVQQHAGQDGHLPSGGLPGLYWPPLPHAAGSKTVPAPGLAPDTAFTTKLALAQSILAAGVPLAWVVVDTVYGRSGVLVRLAVSDAGGNGERGREPLSAVSAFPGGPGGLAGPLGARAPATWPGRRWAQDEYEVHSTHG